MKRVLQVICAAVVFGLCASPLFADEAGTKAVAFLDEARLALSVGDTDGALAAFADSAAAAPSRAAPTYAQMAELYLGKNEIEKAYEKYMQAIALSPNSADYLSGLAIVCARKNEFATAKKYMEKATSAAPSDPDVLVKRGVLAVMEGDNAQAAILFDRALEKRPHDVAARNNRANLYLKEGRAKEALAIYRSLVVQKKDSPSVRVAMAQAYAMLGDTARSKAILEELRDTMAASGNAEAVESISAALAGAQTPQNP